MVLISRISRLFRADLHAVLDRIEEPEALLRQAIPVFQLNVTVTSDASPHHLMGENGYAQLSVQEKVIFAPVWNSGK